MADVKAVLAEIERRLSWVRTWTRGHNRAWTLAVLDGHKELLERHGAEQDEVYFEDCEECPEHPAGDCNGHDRDVCRWCNAPGDDGYCVRVLWPCPDVQGVLACYPDVTP